MRLLSLSATGFSAGGTINGNLVVTGTGSFVTGLAVGTGLGNVDTNILLAVRSDQSADTRTIVINGTNNASSTARTSVRSNAGNIDLIANSIAASAIAQLQIDNTFTGGFIWNMAGTNPISIRTNNAERINLSGAGVVTIGTAAANSVHRINGATVAAASDAPILGVHGPAGTTGEPDLWAKINWNGTEYVFPLWTPT